MVLPLGIVHILRREQAPALLPQESAKREALAGGVVTGVQ